MSDEEHFKLTELCQQAEKDPEQFHESLLQSEYISVVWLFVHFNFQYFSQKILL
jgi:hypothetical protein